MGCLKNNCGCECGCECEGGRERGGAFGGLFGGCNWIWIVLFLLFFCNNDDCGMGSKCGFGLFEDCNFELLLIAGLAFVVLCGCPNSR